MTRSEGRWTDDDVTPGQDPREIDKERQDPAYVEYIQEHGAVTNAEDETGVEMGTSATTRDPYPRDDRPADGPHGPELPETD